MNILLFPLSVLYGIAIRARHLCFNMGFLKSNSPKIRTIVIGNLSVGGTGKTPMVEHLINQLSDENNIAVLSRGYNRKSKGYLIVTPENPATLVGDEPLQIKTKFPKNPVCVCEDRVLGIETIQKDFKEVNLVILDDAFQHRYIEPSVSIVLTDYSCPFYTDHLLPYGNLRDLRSRIFAASIIVVTKCPPNLSPIDAKIIQKNMRLYPYQSLFLSIIDYKEPLLLKDNSTFNLFDDSNISKIHILSGIAKNSVFIKYITEKLDSARELGSQVSLGESILYPDHHNFSSLDIQKIVTLLTEDSCSYIVTTEKDVTRLKEFSELDQFLERIVYIPIEIKILFDKEEDFLNTLRKSIRKVS